MPRSSSGGHDVISPSRRTLFCAAAAIGLIVACPSGADATAADETIPMERRVALSPDGRHIAILRVGRDNSRRVTLVQIVRTDALSAPPMRVRLGDIDAEAIQWGSNQQLLVRVRMEREFSQRAPTGSTMEPDDLTISSRRLISIRVSDGQAVPMFSGPRMRNTRNLGQVVATLPDEAILVAAQAVRAAPGIDVADLQISARFPDAPDIDGPLELHKVDLVTGTSELVETGGLFTTTWRAQDGVAILRRDISPAGDVAIWYARAPATSSWRVLLRERIADAHGFNWVAAGRHGVAIVSCRLPGESVTSVRELDLATLAFGAPIHGRDGRNVETTVVAGDGRYLGAGFRDPDWDYDFVDNDVGADYQTIYRYFGADADVYLQDVSAGRDRYLVQLGGSSPTGSWQLYDRTSGQFTNIASRAALTG